MILALTLFIDGVQFIAGVTGAGDVFDLLASLFITPFVIFLLWMSGNIYSWWEVILLAVGKEIPVVNVLPGYFGIALRHISKSKESRKGGAAVAPTTATSEEEAPDTLETAQS